MMNGDEFREPSANDVFGHSGTAFDTTRIFTFEEAARALVHDITGKYVSPLENALTPLGAAYIDWKNRLEEAAQDTDQRFALVLTRYEDDSRLFIQRDHLMDWCLRHGMRPKFLNPKEAPTSPAPFELAVPGYEPTDELLAAFSAIDKFWKGADKNRPPKKEEVVAWMIDTGLSRNVAEALDTVIRPAWARKGGNKRWEKA